MILEKRSVRFVNGFLPSSILLNQEICEQQRSEEHFTRLPSPYYH